VRRIKFKDFSNTNRSHNVPVSSLPNISQGHDLRSLQAGHSPQPAHDAIVASQRIITHVFQFAHLSASSQFPLINHISGV
jgi:hypothetical protein